MIHSLESDLLLHQHHCMYVFPNIALSSLAGTISHSGFSSCLHYIPQKSSTKFILKHKLLSMSS